MLTRREFNRAWVLGSIVGLVDVLSLVATTRQWTLDDLQYGADALDIQYGLIATAVWMEPSDRLRLIALMSQRRESYGYYVPYEITCSEIPIYPGRTLQQGTVVFISRRRSSPSEIGKCHYYMIERRLNV